MPATPVQIYSANRLDPLFDPDRAREMPIGLRAGDTPAAGTVMGEVTATPGTYRAYATGNVDGSQNPSCILRYGVTSVVAATAPDIGVIISYLGDYGYTAKVVPAFYHGVFATQQLVGMDATVAGKLAGVILEGSYTAGILQF